MEIDPRIGADLMTQMETTPQGSPENPAPVPGTALGYANVPDSIEESVSLREAANVEGVASGDVSPQEAKVIHTFYDKGWNTGDMAEFAAHPKIVHQCQNEFEKYRDMFPDLHINVNSMERRNDEIRVNWTAEGTPANAPAGSQDVPNKESVPGLTRMKIAGDEIVWAKAVWDEQSLQQRLAGKTSG